MNTETPLFTVIIPSYNRESFLKISIDSVLSQTCSAFELIVVDDGSTDSTHSLLSSYHDNRLICIHQANKGVSSARNRALEIAKGQFVAFLDSDDRWLENKLERAKSFIEEFPSISVFHTEEVWYRHGKILSQLKKHKKPTGHIYQLALPLCCIGTSTVVINKKVFSDVGFFDEDMEACEDYDLWLRITNKYEVKLIPEALTIKDGGRVDQLSSSIWGLDRFRIKALEKILLSNVLSTLDRNATLCELKKKCEIFAKGCEKHEKPRDAEYYATLPNKYLIGP
ncbi:MAG: glycosyltransferase [Candidatus Aadella gelida]|nr:glycosyltransferase [Candidatus Aadella gelida]